VNHRCIQPILVRFIDLVHNLTFTNFFTSGWDALCKLQPVNMRTRSWQGRPRTVGCFKLQKPAKNKILKIVKLTGYDYACRNFEYEVIHAMTGNGNHVNLLKLALKIS
jgi:hypothetical protein